MKEITEKNPDKSTVRHFTQYHRGSLDGMRVKDIYSLNLPPRRGDFDQILLQKEVVDI